MEVNRYKKCNFKKGTGIIYRW